MEKPADVLCKLQHSYGQPAAGGLLSASDDERQHHHEEHRGYQRNSNIPRRGRHPEAEGPYPRRSGKERRDLRGDLPLQGGGAGGVPRKYGRIQRAAGLPGREPHAGNLPGARERYIQDTPGRYRDKLHRGRGKGAGTL